MNRKVFNPAFLILVWTFSFLNSYANADYEERKQINKTYQVSASTSVSFTNSFGRLHINTWDKRELQVDIEVITRSSSQTRAKEMLDRIRIDISDASPSASISFKTVISEMKSSGNNSFEINYTVSMPKDNPLYVKNSFGDAYIGDYNGKLTVNESYGNLKAEDLNGETSIDLSFGGGTSSIGSLKKGRLEVGYSSLDVGLIGQAEVEAQFSNIDISKAVDLALTAKYGEVSLGEVNELDATVNFASFDLDKLGKKLILDIEYGGKTTIHKVSNELSLLDIECSFGPVYIDLPADLNSSIRVYVEFGSLKMNHDHVDFNRIHEGNTSKEYQGKIGSGSSVVSVEIESKYGDVTIDQE
jgi:hypothetical protein